MHWRPSSAEESGLLAELDLWASHDRGDASGILYYVQASRVQELKLRMASLPVLDMSAPLEGPDSGVVTGRISR